MAQARFDFDRDIAPLVFFTSRICHDLNNMITGGMGAVSLLELKLTSHPDVSLDPEIQRLNLAMEAFSDLPRRLEGIFLRGIQEAIPFDLQHVVSLLLRKHDNARHPIHFEGTAAPMTVDVEAMCDAISALIINAQEAMPDGGDIFMHLTVDQDSHAPKCTLKIKDRGHGIAEDFIHGIFQPFRSYHKRGNLVGLGLTLAGSVIQRHRGELVVDSEEGKGTVVSMILPMD